MYTYVYSRFIVDRHFDLEMETDAAWDNASYKGSMSSAEGTIPDDTADPYYAKVVRKDTARYPTNIEKQEKRNTKSNNYNNNVNFRNGHVKSKSVSSIKNSLYSSFERNVSY